MGEIVQKPNGYGAGERTYYSSLGYRIPVVPKTRKQHDAWGRLTGSTDDYSLKALEKAEREYVFFVKAMSENFGSLFTVEQSGVGSRVASVAPRVVDGFPGWFNGFCVFNLQTGLVHNIPMAKLGKLVGENLAVGRFSPEATGNGNHVGGKSVGLKAVHAVKFISIFKEKLEKVYSSQGYAFTDEDFVQVLTLFRLNLSGYIFGDVKQWLPYLKAGLGVKSVQFAFDFKLWGPDKVPVPVAQVEAVEGIPTEWAKLIL